MKNNTISVIVVLVIVFLTALIFINRTKINNDNTESNLKTLYVAPVTVECMGIIPQRCYQIREINSSDFTLLYTPIKNFEYVPGYEYELLVKETNTQDSDRSDKKLIDSPNKIQDKSSTEYELVNVVNKKEAKYVIITSPEDNANVKVDQPITVTGEGMGLFEGNVVVEAQDLNNTVLAQNFTTLNAPDIGEKGDWETQLSLKLPTNIVEGKIVAYSPSPKDGSNDAYYSLPVTFYKGTPPAQGAQGTSSNAYLAGTKWILNSYLDENGKIAPAVQSSRPTAEFTSESISGTNGCNNYNGPYQTDGDAITFGQISSTMMYCENTSINKQETNYMKNLGQTTSFSVEGPEGNSLLIFKNSAGEEVLRYERA